MKSFSVGILTLLLLPLAVVVALPLVMVFLVKAMGDFVIGGYKR